MVAVRTSPSWRPKHFLYLIPLVSLVGFLTKAFSLEHRNWSANPQPPIRWAYNQLADNSSMPRPRTSFRECAKYCPAMVIVPPGTFVMGSPATEPGRYENEGPQHRIAIKEALIVSKFDITFADWEACVSARACPEVDDGGMGYDIKPVINVTWDEAQQYAVWLSHVTGQPYRLLTETEWEYAARAGRATAYFWGAEIGKNNANCNGCGGRWDGELTAPVGSFLPNRFGLYDMAGNVGQWTQDCYHDNYEGAPADGSAWAGGDCTRHVVRGGAWDGSPRQIRSASRYGYLSASRISDLGFRVGRRLALP